MPQLDKLRRRIEQNPKVVYFKDLDRLLRASGFQFGNPVEVAATIFINGAV